jgi:hypothetical protein
MTTLRLRNADPARTLVVRVWHRPNALMSDGDLPWLDEDGAPTASRSRDHTAAPGGALALVVREGLAFTVVTDGPAQRRGLTDAVRDFLRTGSTDSGGGAGGASFSLGNESAAALRVRVFASATFQFAPRQEIELAPGDTTVLSTGEGGISVRVD